MVRLAAIDNMGMKLCGRQAKRESVWWKVEFEETVPLRNLSREKEREERDQERRSGRRI